MSISSRRNLLKLGLGAAQIALLDRFGIPILSSRKAHAASSGPSRLLTIYVPGGWLPIHLWNPLAAADITRLLPGRTATGANGEDTVYFDAAQVSNLDGSGDADADAPMQRLRVVRTWDDAEMQKGGPISRPSTINGHSWMHYKLWENSCVIHGVDQGTAAHNSGTISAMCGAAGPDYRAPALQALVANALSGRFPDRPLPNVCINGAPFPASLNLPAVAAPTVIAGIGSLDYTLSRNKDRAWKDFRETANNTSYGFDSAPDGTIATNAMDELVLERTRNMRGAMNTGADEFYRKLYEGYQGVSKVLARDVVSTLSKTKGPEFAMYPFYASSSAPWGISGAGRHSDSGGTWSDSFDLALRLMKSDLASSVVLNCNSMGNGFLDTHGSDESQFNMVREVFEVIGRLLGEMKATPSPSAPGKNLLDDTLVVMVSDFARTWPYGNSDHWPITSVAYAGGGLSTNRMIGNYMTDGSTMGVPADVIDEGGAKVNRALRSADIIHTAAKIMGVEKFAIPGGSGEIFGVRPG